MSQPAARGPFVSAASNALSLVVLLGLSIATYGYERSLQPLYGSAPTHLHLNKVVWLACIAGMFTPTLSLSNALLAVGALLCAMPQTAYWAAAHTGRWHDPVWGPVATHACVIGPVLYWGIAIVKELQKSTELQGSPFQAMSLPVCRMAIMTLQDLWPTFEFLCNTSERDLLVYIGCAALVSWAALPFVPSFDTITVPGRPAVKARSNFTSSNLMRLAVLPLVPFIFNNLQPPTLPKPLPEPFIHPETSLRILSSVGSPYSGVVVVGEVPPPTPAMIKAGNVTEPHSIRYMRAGHSLLGGVWLGERVFSLDRRTPLGHDKHSTPIGDSIYSAFVAQEAALLVERPGAGEKQSALMIGLGTGIAASSFIKRGVSTTIVEVDQAVYDAATEYFGLEVAEPDKVYISDGRGFVIQRTENTTSADDGSKAEYDPFDFVIHDLFSGGGVPSHLFTLRFWQDLTKIIKPDAVVTVNFAGSLQSDSAKAVYLTLKENFPQCRVFHDSVEPMSQEKLKTEFVNWIFFCSPSPEPLIFRPAVEADFLRSFLRSRILSTISEREVSGDLIVGGLDLADKDVKEKYILTDEKSSLTDWQDVEALRHWRLMRDVLSDVYWETY
ncbi:uncharacterized protein PHACADRAFT_249744 [Phanerochaete carnosa HHB-10118-sp]|uniref:PABS domain-containing protein n=1 Tax=Phanerochaete carnosa (strain HHB-10118-sp) TaxID=650164 RepID=K5W5Z3_PHACS|nr:uncharacterized protein PHACADRAFT_249744 [Phanerochaete carnosa HHB-10118-sp]EKM59323.1 hypothetical protein PHACADRAFT_249744 [Phanerochaete carnosa HHB-10118-sp]